MKNLIISIVAAASLLTAASVAGAGYEWSTVNGPTCMYMTTGIVCD
jgi:hypothetical protein